ncbi:hypothetical protein Thi970DRAFT_04639 [Thiorhodovibrio frisius]|uniref:Uncharacterized protein n=2 Tax=Thiorhodovibrio frisius TaxID=631362 RepID=H8Z7U7_9GAMM|nr:hypothetical protein [Thiorhodovibrio frisius]EIC20959.1 hypothetical protein Thi970DRAFT_04639 [Thiorhodovibrio frisius]WPL22018.1 hypothetical protein Thiofri_02165 [Thiorhodovibrio frisius]
MTNQNPCEAKADFEKWAKGFSGCSGGNIKGDYWICGIEWAGSLNESDLKFNDVTSPSAWKDDQKYRKWQLKSRYNQNALKLYAAMLDKTVTDYRQIGLASNGPFTRKSNTFKMNLYPISFRKDLKKLWTTWLPNKTGLPTKACYQKWCRDNRFPVIRGWVEEHSPKVIIGTSRDYMDDFVLAFGGKNAFQENIRKIKEQGEDIGAGRKLNWLELDGKSKGNRTLLVVTPFLGAQQGLNSNQLLQATGAKIAQRQKTLMI